MNILIVDDIESNIIALKAVIEASLDVNIETADNGEDALKKAFEGTIDLILLDIRMPVMNGFEVAAYLRANAKTANIPIIFLTAEYTEEEFRKKGYEIGAIAYLTKPVQEDQLINMIRVYSDLIQSNNELKELNRTLEAKIEEGILMARKKDNILFQQSKMAQMGEMLSMIAHQWRQPLSVLNGIFQNLQVKMIMNEEQIKNDKAALDEFLAYVESSMQKSTDCVLNLSQTITDFSGFYKEKNEYETCTINVPIRNCMEMMKGSFKNSSIEVVNNCTSQNEFKMHVNEMTQVLLTIFQNASENFIERGIENPQIEISTFDDGDRCIVEISDNGGGIEEENLNRIFDLYFSTKKESKGTGMGLYMTKLILENHHNGTIEVSNTDKGACFKIVI